MPHFNKDTELKSDYQRPTVADNQPRFLTVSCTPSLSKFYNNLTTPTSAMRVLINRRCAGVLIIKVKPDNQLKGSWRMEGSLN